MIVGTVINAGSWYQLLAKGEDNTIEVVKLGEVKPEELVLKLK